MYFLTSRIKTADKTYTETYEDEVQGFIGRVKERARIRVEKAMQEYEEVRNSSNTIVIYCKELECL